MVQTKAQLLASANQIKDETAPNANTATRVGEMLVNVIDSFGVLVPFKLALDNAQLLAAGAYDITELPAPGAGYAWAIVEASCKLSGAGTLFDGSPNIQVQAETAARYQFDDQQYILQLGTDTWTNLTRSSVNDTPLVENKKMQVVISAPSAVGDGEITIYGLARLITL